MFANDLSVGLPVPFVSWGNHHGRPAYGWSCFLQGYSLRPSQDLLFDFHARIFCSLWQCQKIKSNKRFLNRCTFGHLKTSMLHSTCIWAPTWTADVLRWDGFRTRNAPPTRVGAFTWRSCPLLWFNIISTSTLDTSIFYEYGNQPRAYIVHIKTY